MKLKSIFLLITASAMTTVFAESTKMGEPTVSGQDFTIVDQGGSLKMLENPGQKAAAQTDFGKMAPKSPAPARSDTSAPTVTMTPETTVTDNMSRTVPPPPNFSGPGAPGAVTGSTAGNKSPGTSMGQMPVGAPSPTITPPGMSGGPVQPGTSSPTIAPSPTMTPPTPRSSGPAGTMPGNLPTPNMNPPTPGSSGPTGPAPSGAPLPTMSPPTPGVSSGTAVPSNSAPIMQQGMGGIPGYTKEPVTATSNPITSPSTSQSNVGTSLNPSTTATQSQSIQTNSQTNPSQGASTSPGGGNVPVQMNVPSGAVMPAQKSY